jgi:hypothetical protein
MGKLHHLFTPAELKKLDKTKQKELQAKLTGQIKKDPMLKAIIKAHENMRKHLKEKLK